MKNNKYILSFLYAEDPYKLQRLLEKMNKLSYELVSVHEFLKFKKTERNLSYHIDLHSLTPERRAFFDNYNFYFIDQMNGMCIYASENPTPISLDDDLSEYKTFLTSKHGLLKNLVLAVLFISIVFLLGPFALLPFLSKFNFIMNSPTIGSSLCILLSLFTILFVITMGQLKKKAIKRSNNLLTTINTYNKVFNVTMCIIYLLATLLTVYIQLNLEHLLSEFYIILMGFFAYYSFKVNTSTICRMFVYGLVVIIVTFDSRSISNTIKTLSLPDNYPDKHLITDVEKSRFVYSLYMQEETKDTSWIDDFYLVCKDDSMHEELFEYFVIETERGCRLPNTNVFTNTTLEAELSEKAVPSLSFDDAFDKFTEIDDNMWICGDYLFAKQDQVFIRIAFDDLEHAKQRLQNLLNY